MIRLSKEIWYYLLNHNMYITPKYLPLVLNTAADRESRKKPKLFKVASSSKKFSSGLSITRLSDNRPICFPPMPSTTSIYSLAPDPYSQGTDATLQNWNIRLPYAFPPSSMISRVLLKIKQKCVPLLILIAPFSLKPLCQETSAAAALTRNSDKPKKYCPLIDGWELIDTSGLVCFRKTFFCEGISDNAFHIITNSKRKDTLANYESA